MSNELLFTDLQDAIDKAQILINEELLLDAKKILRKVLIIDPDLSEAKALLSEIQKIELKQLMDDSINIKKNKHDKKEIINLDEIISELEKKIKTTLKEKQNPAIKLFGDENNLVEFKIKINKTIKNYNDREMLDLSIAFYEMEVFDLTIYILENLSHQSQLYLSSQILICKSLIALNMPIEAIVKLESILKNTEMNEYIRCNVNYLLGSAYETINDKKRANEYYRYVYKLNPRFKDVMEKTK